MNELVVRMGISGVKTHSLYEEFLAAPPEGVRYLTDYYFAKSTSFEREPIGSSRLIQMLTGNGLVRQIADRFLVAALPDPESSMRNWIPYTAERRLWRLVMGSRIKAIEETPFDVFHSGGSAMLESIPWIVEKDIHFVSDFESAASLFGYYGNWRKRIYQPSCRRIISKQLSSHYCRRLLPWTEAAMKTVAALIPDKRVLDKTEVVRLAIRPAPPPPSDLETHDRIRILFLGSSNYGGEFWSKGGLEVLESYRILRENVGDQVDLVFRCWMPDELRRKYSSLPGLHLIPGTLSRDDLNRLFWESDLFLFPSHNTPGMAFLEAMRFGLPVVSKNIWANSEIIRDGITGFLVNPSERIPYYLPGNVPNWSMDSGNFLSYMTIHDERVVNDLVDRLTRLVDSRNLRDRMGRAARKEVEEGELSIAARNSRLRRIYEESARR